MTRTDLIQRARDIVQEHGGQVAVAEKLGVRQPSVSKALKAADTSMDSLLLRIVREVGGIAIDEEPVYIVREPNKKKGVKR